MKRVQRYTPYLLCLLLLLGCVSAKAQVVQWSNPTKLKGSAVFTKVIGENEHGIFLLRYRNKFFNKNIIIDKYQHHLTLDLSKNIELKRSRLVKIQMTEKGILLIKSKFERSSQSNVLYGQYYNYELKPIGKEIKLSRSKIREFGDRGDFRVRISENEQRIAVYFSDRSDKNETVVNWQIFDAAFKPISSHSYQLPVDHRKHYLVNFFVTDSADVYSLSRELLEKDRKDRRTIDRFFMLEDDSLRNIQFHDSVIYRDLKMTYNRQKNTVQVIGFYGEHEMYGSKGISLLTYHIEKRRSVQRFVPFRKEFTEQVNTGRHHAQIVPEGFEFIKLVPRSDGGLVCIAEQKEIATENDIIMVNGIPTSTSKNIYNYNDIIALNLDSTGKIEWEHVVHKNQTTVNDGGYFSSVAVYVADHFIQLIYNDQLRTAGEVMQVTLFSNGKQSSKKLLKTKLDFVVVIPVESEQVSSNKIIIPSSKNRRFALLKLVYD